jgi:hypothetical protein
MFSSNVWPCQTLPTLLLGSITSAIGITVLPWAIYAEYTNLVYGMMVLVGHGIMMRTNPGSLHCLAYFPNMTARITCLLSFANPFGGFVGLTIMTTVFTNKSGIDQQDPKTGMMWAFIALAPFMWLSVLLTPFLGNVWISRDGAHEVVNGAYLWSFVSRKRLTMQRMTRGEGFGFGNIAPIDATKDENDVEAGSKHLNGVKSIEVALATMPAALILPSSPEYDKILDSGGHGTE